MRSFLRSAFGDLRIVPRQERRDGDGARSMTPGLAIFSLEAWLASANGRRVLLDLHRQLRGTTGRPDLAQVRADLERALREGDLLVLKEPRRRLVVPLQSDVPPPPDGEDQDATTWFEVKLLDEVGDPVSGVDLVITCGDKTEKATTSGAGKARVEGRGGSAQVRLAKETALRKSLYDLWSKPRDKAWYEAPPEDEPNHTYVEVTRTESIGGATLLAETPHTIVLQPRVVQANLKGMWFATSKSFLLPTARHSLQLVKGLYDDNKETDMLIVGHTDTEGSDAYNDPLSLERAESIAAYLKDDVDAWYAWYGAGKPQEKRWGHSEDAAMARALAEESGETIGDEGEVKWYQRTRGMDPSGKADEATRKALIAEYMGLDGTTLPDDITPLTHGCGEHFPAEATGDGVADQANRRVEIFFFHNPVAPPDRPSAVLPPPPGKNSKAGSKEYPEWRKRVRELHEFEVGHWIRLVMKYDDGTTAQGVPFKIKYSDGAEITAHTSEDGILMVHGKKEQSWDIVNVEDESIVTSFQ